jgi:hypothetical protein
MRLLQVLCVPDRRKAPEVDLWAAVLLDACEIVAGQRRATDSERERALHWVRAVHGEAGGFDWACEQLGINSSWLRNAVENASLGRDRQRS